MQCESVCMSFWSRYAEEIYTVVKHMYLYSMTMCMYTCKVLSGGGGGGGGGDQGMFPP